MRSRFSAFALGRTEYLLHSWSRSTRPESLTLDPGVRWYRLDILETVAGGPLEDHGIVEFEAFYRDEEGRGSQHERSTFRREDRRWVYVDAVAEPGAPRETKPGRS